MRLSCSAWAVLVSSLAGCSLLYNPSNLPDPEPRIDAPPPPDAPTDANVEMPTFRDIGPRVLLEGQGTGGSRPAILAIVGGNFGPDATVSIEPTAGADSTLLIVVDNLHAVRSPSGTAIAVPVTLPVDPAHGQTGVSDVPLTITISQMGDRQPVSLKISDKVVLRNLPELTAPITAAPSPALYSQVKLTAPLVFAARKAGAPAVIEAVGSIELADVHADGSADAPGPGGGVGGVTMPNPGPGGGVGGGKAAVLLAVGSSASGGGFGTEGGPGVGLGPVTGGITSGDDLITSYASNTSGGGGGGGSVGGGGGGTLELTAGGTLTLGKISANGASGGSGGGGGSGGAIVLRSGALATLSGDITATGGAANNKVSVGGLGRLRYDLPAQVGTPAMTAVARKGVAFDTGDANPLVTTDAHARLRVLSEPSSMWNVSVLDAQGTTTSSSTVMFASGAAVITPPLGFGYNRICVTPMTGNPTIRESTNCLDLAYVP